MKAGREFGSYKLISRIGAGGMGEVWKAEDPRLRRTVAIKILPADSAEDTESNARFVREARTAAQLYHPNIATIHSIEEHEGRLFIVMEHVEGEPLTRAIRSGRLGEAEVAYIGRGVAEALAEAHANGIVHRDIKPDNIILSGQRVKILDFGIAKKYQTEKEAMGTGATFTDFRTQRGVILGTIQYMSPEQAMGKQLDGRSDVFSLGVVLYEAATNRLPFRGETATDTLTRIIRDDPPDLRVTHPKLSPELTDAIMTCLAKERERRFPNASELAKALDEILAGSHTSRRSSASGRTPTAISIREEEVTTGVAAAGGVRVTEGVPATKRASRGAYGPWPWIFATTLVAALSIAGTAWFVTRVVQPPAETTAPASSVADVGEPVPAQLASEIVVEPTDERDGATLQGDGEPEVATALALPEESARYVRPDELEVSTGRTMQSRQGLREDVAPAMAMRPPPEPPDDLPDRAKGEAYLRRGVWQVAHGHEGEGMESLERAVALDSNLVRAYLPLGITALRNRRSDDAVKAFSAVLERRDAVGPRDVEIASFGKAIAEVDLIRMNLMCMNLPVDREFGELRRLARDAGADCEAPLLPPRPPGGRDGNRRPPAPRPNP